MKASTLLATKLFLGCALSLSVSQSYSEVLFKDDFESGGLAQTFNGARWTNKANVTNSSDRAASGKYSAKFAFLGSSDLSMDATAELRFDLGKLSKEIWIQYSMFVPSNYVHRDATSSENNKILRLWGNVYDDIEKVGFCTWRTTGDFSDIRADWNDGRGIGPKGPFVSFISANDLGKWMTVKVYAKAATESSPGTIKLWKNGALLIDGTNTVNNFKAGETHAYRYGYLLGWANSGFAQSTNFYIDNVVFATKESELGGTTSVQPSAAPTAPELRLSN